MIIDWMLNNIEVIISGVAFIVSLFALIRTELFNKKILRETVRNNYSAALYDIDSKYLEYPELWTIYDNNKLGISRKNTPEEKGKRQALLYLHFNLFESVFTTYNNVLGKLSKADKEFWKTWKNFIKEFVEGCSEARELLEDQNFQQVYRKEYKDFLRKIIEDAKPQND